MSGCIPKDCITAISDQIGKLSKIVKFRKLPDNEKATKFKLEDGYVCVHVCESVLRVS